MRVVAPFPYLSKEKARKKQRKKPTWPCHHINVPPGSSLFLFVVQIQKPMNRQVVPEKTASAHINQSLAVLYPRILVSSEPQQSLWSSASGFTVPGRCSSNHSLEDVPVSASPIRPWIRPPSRSRIRILRRQVPIPVAALIVRVHMSRRRPIRMPTAIRTVRRRQLAVIPPLRVLPRRRLLLLLLLPSLMLTPRGSNVSPRLLGLWLAGSTTPHALVTRAAVRKQFVRW